MQNNHSIKSANFITLKAKLGQEEKLAQFLAGGAKAVAATEPPLPLLGFQFASMPAAI